MAITWRTVAQTNIGAAANLLNSGTQDMMQGIDSLRRLAQEQQQLNIQSAKAVREKNTNDYLDQVGQVTSAADLSNPETQQQLMQLRQSYGQMIDRSATRDAIDQRLLGLQKQEVATNQYTDQQLERDQRPLLEQITSAGRSGDRATVDRLLAENSFINEARVAADADSLLDAGTNRQYRANAENRAVRGEARAERSEARQAEQFQMNREDRQENRQLRRDTNLLTAAELELKAGEAALRASNPLANTSTDVLADSNRIVDANEKYIEPWFGDNAEARDMLKNRFQGLMKDGIDFKGDIGKVKIPPALLEQYMSSIKDDAFRSVSSMESNLDDWLKTYATTNPGAFRQAGEVGKEIQKLREASRLVNAGKIDVLRGKKLDSGSLSDNIQTIRNRIPTDTR